MATTRKSPQAVDALDVLMQDHKNVQKLFREFEQLEEEDEDEMSRIVERACVELKVHARAEEEIFYPAVRSAAKTDDDEDLLDEAAVEHEVVSELIEKLEAMGPGDSLYRAYFTVLSEYVKHHVKEEEKELFPRVKRMKSLDLDDLGEQLTERKQALMAELGESEDEEESDEEDEGKSRAATVGASRTAARRSRRSASR
jgi:hemerythrin superfamily protein